MQVKRSALAVIVIVAVCGSGAIAQGPPKTWPQDEGLRVVKEVQRRMAGLDHYGVFDWLTFGIEGKTIVLKGYNDIIAEHLDNRMK